MNETAVLDRDRVNEKRSEREKKGMKKGRKRGRTNESVLFRYFLSFDGICLTFSCRLPRSVHGLGACRANGDRRGITRRTEFPNAFFFPPIAATRWHFLAIVRFMGNLTVSSPITSRIRMNRREKRRSAAQVFRAFPPN